ncbi:hypothetical protein J1G44_18675 [Cellulomonas sp. zg-ZUI199]|uniref:ABC transporter permease n=1 Tax=Cellulomonas wangleii TaxID=2816956 RepID=A0ABX8D8R0_9CELL|nr:hypothetical protein [Cellulomonas wangleii]MBO0926503.1 hypothetical protein [Cellulomonas wangleii]QVI63834.1 hypothetical protein KG103_08440 [Cellulomonas wangleii]
MTTGGRHPADDDGVSRRAEIRHLLAGPVLYGLRRLSVAVACLACAAVAGGTGSVIAPLIGQPRAAGFWGGATIMYGVIVIAAVVCMIGHEIDSRRFRWVDRVYSYLD